MILLHTNKIGIIHYTIGGVYKYMIYIGYFSISYIYINIINDILLLHKLKDVK